MEPNILVGFNFLNVFFMLMFCFVWAYLPLLQPKSRVEFGSGCLKILRNNHFLLAFFLFYVKKPIFTAVHLICQQTQLFLIIDFLSEQLA